MQSTTALSGFFARLAKDSAGNTLALVAASIAPILAMVGGGVDMGRSYLAEARLQQACDSGVLAARKRLGSQVVVDGDVSDDVAETGHRFFDVNFRDTSYGTEDREFTMALEEDYSISGEAKVTVPTTVMAVFGFTEVPVEVSCEAQLNFANTDVMMVLDTTGSMAENIVGEGLPRIAVLKSTIISFFTQLEQARSGNATIRYGFVPYSTNVNVGDLLKDEWVVDEWSYPTRSLAGSASSEGSFTYYSESTPISGSRNSTVDSTYAATFSELSGYTCATLPVATLVTNYEEVSKTEQDVLVPLPGKRITEVIERTRNGDAFYASLSGNTCTVTRTSYVNYVDTYTQIHEPSILTTNNWRYDNETRDVTDWRTTANGCIEERKTYEIADYDNVDLNEAMDLDIDREPTSGDPDTQWRPMYPNIIYDRAMLWDGSGAFTSNAVVTTDEYVHPNSAGMASCPPPAKKLQSFTLEQLVSYLGTLAPSGTTYHDIGMIWGGRLLSPTGIFANENADRDGSNPTSRNLIFLTDGQNEPLDLSYTSYGVEPIDKRRWSQSSGLTLQETVEARFAFACKEVKKKNITVWLIAFGTTLNPVMTECAGPGRAFQASDTASLNTAFSDIAKSLGDLRISK